MTVNYGSWTINGKSPTFITGVQIDPPKITLKCASASKDLGGQFDDPLDEVKLFNGMRCWNVETVELLNNGTFVWGDRKHELLEISDGEYTYWGVIESVKWEIDMYSNDLIEYDISLVIELPSDPEDFFNHKTFSDGFDPSVFQGGSSP